MSKSVKTQAQRLKQCAVHNWRIVSKHKGSKSEHMRRSVQKADEVHFLERYLGYIHSPSA